MENDLRWGNWKFSVKFLKFSRNLLNEYVFRDGETEKSFKHGKFSSNMGNLVMKENSRLGIWEIRQNMGGCCKGIVQVLEVEKALKHGWEVVAWNCWEIHKINQTWEVGEWNSSHLGNPEIYKNMGSCLNPFIHSHLIWNFIKCSALLSETV